MVRQRSAKPLFIGSIPIAASNNFHKYNKLGIQQVKVGDIDEIRQSIFQELVTPPAGQIIQATPVRSEQVAIYGMLDMYPA